VKYLRTFILILLAVLLPVRGAVAAAMLCPGESMTIATVVVAEHGHHDMHAGQDVQSHHTATHDHSHGHPSNDSPSGTHQSACQFCAGGGCCVTPLAFAPPAVVSPMLITSAAFPALTARVTVHYPDGQDRPPRTI
jgi:hypothetical protein